MRFLVCYFAFAFACFVAASASARAAVLLLAEDGQKLTGLELAQVMAEDSSSWLRVRLNGRTRLAVITADALVERAPAADAFFRALDESTRVRVLPPYGAFTCAGSSALSAADPDAVEPALIHVQDSFVAGSALELEQALRVAGFDFAGATMARFAERARGPYSTSLFRVPDAGGVTATLRVSEQGHALEAPRVFASDGVLLPMSFIALSSGDLEPELYPSADASELLVKYRARAQSSDYLEARGRWLADNAPRALCESRSDALLFRFRVGGGAAPLAPLATRYFRNWFGPGGANCATAVGAAQQRGSQDVREFGCNGADDLARVLGPLGFVEPRSSRFFTLASEEGIQFRRVAASVSGPLLRATDLDATDCSPVPLVPSPPGGAPPVPSVSNPTGPEGNEALAGTPIYQSDGSCNLVLGSADSCSGDSTTSNDASDACSGDPSSGQSREACSGDSASGETASDESCSGDSESTGDATGCSKSEYDGDTCTGNSTPEAQTQLLQSGPRPKPRPLRLSLLTWLAAALALPLRRIAGSR